MYKIPIRPRIHGSGVFCIRKAVLLFIAVLEIVRTERTFFFQVPPYPGYSIIIQPFAFQEVPDQFFVGSRASLRWCCYVAAVRLPLLHQPIIGGDCVSFRLCKQGKVPIVQKPVCHSGVGVKAVFQNQPRRSSHPCAVKNTIVIIIQLAVTVAVIPGFSGNKPEALCGSHNPGNNRGQLFSDPL